MSDHYSFQKKSSLQSDGSRPKIRVADVSGRFTKARSLFFIILIGVYALVPWIKIGGHPLIFIDILHRRFYLFGQTFNAQDFYMVFFLVSGGAFTLFYLTAMAGRVWCGWACPQTVFLEGVFRPIERWIEGPKSAQLALAKEPFSFKKLRIYLTKYFLYGVCALVVSHIFISYFVSLDDLLHFIRQNPREHPVAFLWMAAITAVILINFAWFREQLCLIVCPYGKLQSVLIDDDTIMIGYDEKRGEPRGKKSDLNRGSCINCNRCVDVCPTGIDIRNGLQLECVGCANCIDACDEIMQKIGQPTGLIRYDSLNGLSGKPRQIWRPRLYLYTVLFLLGVGVFSFYLFHHHPFEVNVLRAAGAPFTLVDKKVQNQFVLHLVNKAASRSHFVLTILPIQVEDDVAEVTLPVHTIDLESLEDRRIPVFVTLPRAHHDDDDKHILIPVSVTRFENDVEKETVKRELVFLFPDDD